MDSATEDIYLQKIEEYVYDEDKIVTFRWLCYTLDISVKESQSLLEKYVMDHRELKPDELAVTYIVSGMIEENTRAFSIVKEDELANKKSAFKSILSRQIYSVQKCKQADSGALSLVDYFDIHSPKEKPLIGSIISKNCVQRVFKSKKALPPPQQAVNKEKPSFFAKVLPQAPERDNVTVDKDANKPEKNGISKVVKQNTKETAKAKPKQKNGIAGFLTKANDKSKVTQKTSHKEGNDAGVELKTQNVLSQETKVMKEVKKFTLNEKIDMIVDTDTDSEDVISPTQNAEVNIAKEKPKKSVKRQKKNKKQGEPNPKRRKRIVENNDSDSDDIFGDGDMDKPTEIEMAERYDDSEPIFTSPTPLEPTPKNKKRKLVDKTFTDEEGFIITTKEWVCETASEDEVEVVKDDDKMKLQKTTATISKVEVKERPKQMDSKSESDTPSDSKVQNGKAKGGKGKKVLAPNQQTLMSFFKRK